MKRPKRTSAKTITKAQFVRAQPPDMPAREVVERARAAGLGAMSEHYVYNIRSLARGQVPARGASPVERAARGSRDVEEILRAVALEIGVGRAIAILEAERKKARAVLREA